MPPRKNSAPPDEPGVIWIGIKADEYNRELLATLLLFAKYPNTEALERQLKAAREAGVSPMVKLPGEDDPELEPVLDPVATRAEIATRLRAYIEKHGRPLAEAFLAEYGAKKVSEIPEDKLGHFLAELKRSQAVPPKGKK